MGRQTMLECLRVELRFINGQMFIECLPARSRASPQILNGQGKTGQVRSGLVLPSLDWS